MVTQSERLLPPIFYSGRATDEKLHDELKAASAEPSRDESGLDGRDFTG